VYATILADDRSSVAQSGLPADFAVSEVGADESNSDGAQSTNELQQALASSIQKLSEASGAERQMAVAEALSKASYLASRIGDDTNLALDPDLNSYYLQNIVVKRVPELLSEVGELQAILQAADPNSAPSSDHRTRHRLLDGMIRSTIEGIKRDSSAAYRGDADGRLQQAGAGSIGSMLTAVDSYLTAANATITNQGSATSLAHSYRKAWKSVDSAWAIGQSELKRLLNRRLSDLTQKLRSSLLTNGLFVGLSLLLAALTYRHIVTPLRQLEGLAGAVRETKDYTLRANLNRRDEIGQLATAINSMLEELAKSRDREFLEQQRNATMQAELARVSRLTTMGQMAASIAHDINQPLAGVVNNANAGLRWLKRQPPDIGEVEAALRRIVSDGERGAQILEGIRASLKKGDRERIELDLNELIYGVIKLTHAQFQRYGVSLRSDLADDLPTMPADRVQLEQVIVNLFMNAAEATLSSSDHERLVHVRSEKFDGSGALISVEDSGTGISPEDMKRIFDAFFTTKREGMGLGLSICRSIVEAHGGRIKVAKAVPHGSVFQIFLPGERA
jgi:C4-dicarboxylate-specific signal transduction histidine kinase